jgi:SAM-dependent methyltransferase
MIRTVDDADPPETTVPCQHFDDLHTKVPDPWGLATKWFERRKYEITIASLPRERYVSCFEPGCSIGELTRLLAARCDCVLASDCASAAVARARSRLADLEHVEVRQACLPHELPDDRYELVVASEILYYFSRQDLADVLDGLVARLVPGGDLVAVHHRASDRCHGYDGFNVHGIIASHPGLAGVVHHDDDGFVLDVLRRHDP